MSEYNIKNIFERNREKNEAQNKKNKQQVDDLLMDYFNNNNKSIIDDRRNTSDKKLVGLSAIFKQESNNNNFIMSNSGISSNYETNGTTATTTAGNIYQQYKSASRMKLLRFSEIKSKPIVSAISQSNTSSLSTTNSAQQQKSYVQKLYEIKQIQPVIFDLLESTGPAHKPQFKMSLKIKINSFDKQFFGTGASKKIAKLNASEQALKHLCELENFLDSTQKLEINSMFLMQLQGFSATSSAAGSTAEFDNLKDCKLFTNFVFPKAEPTSPLPISEKIEKIISEYNTSTNPNKNIISLFTEIFPFDDYKFEIISEAGESHAKQFKMRLNLMYKQIDRQYEASGSSKKQAKLRVAQLALEDLFNVKLLNPITSTHKIVLNDESVDHKQFKQFSDSLSELIKSKFSELISELTSTQKEDDLNKIRNVYAAIVQTNGYSTENAKLICITSGTKCISGEFMSQLGTALNDCHAEIVAIRQLRRYLYEQLELYVESLLNTNDHDDDNYIFELSDDSKEKLFRLKDNCMFHLYISTTPCGDGRVFSPHESEIGIDSHPNRKIRGILRAKLESGEGTIPVGSELINQLQTWDGILAGERLKIMSCSDKLCKLNVVGVQGALLSHFVETIYLDSIIIGSFYHSNHLSRALYGRISQHLDILPNGYRLNKPILSSITNSDIRQLTRSSNKAYIWSLHTKTVNLEILSTKHGKLLGGQHSSVCKLSLFECWNRINNLLKTNLTLFTLTKLTSLYSLNEEQNTYSHIKNASIDYQNAKKLVYQAFNKASLGVWVRKPFEQNFFELLKIEST